MTDTIRKYIRNSKKEENLNLSGFGLSTEQLNNISKLLSKREKKNLNKFQKGVNFAINFLKNYPLDISDEIIDYLKAEIKWSKLQISGALVAKKIENKVYIGWSKVHNKDKIFSKAKAVKLAEDRILAMINRPKQKRNSDILSAFKEAEKSNGKTDPVSQFFGKKKIPNSFKYEVFEFVERCKKYFKVEDIYI